MKNKRLSLDRTEKNSLPENSLTQRLGPGTRVVLALGGLAMAGLGDGSMLAGMGAGCLSLLLLSSVSLKRVVRVFRNVIWLLIFVGLFPALFTPGIPVFHLQGFPFIITWEGLYEGGLAVARLSVMFLVSFLLIHTTPPEDLMKAVEKVSSRVKPGGVFLREMLQVAVLTFQMFPRFCGEAEKQFFRKVSDNPGTCGGGLLRRVRAAVQLLTPLTVGVFTDPGRFSGPGGEGKKERGPQN